MDFKLMKVKLSKVENNILDKLYSDRNICDRRGCFTSSFRLWNDTFHKCVNKKDLDWLTKKGESLLTGNIGTLNYAVRVVRVEKCVVITHLYFPSFKFTFLVPPKQTDTHSSYIPRQQFILPQDIQILKNQYYSGVKIGLYKGRYTILNSQLQPIVKSWLDKKPKMFP